MAGTVTKPEALSAEQIAGMNLAQLRTEIKTHYDRAAEIEAQYPGPITKSEDEDEVKRLLSTIDKMETALMPLEDSATRKSRINDNVKRYNTAAYGHQHPTPQMSPEEKAFWTSPGRDFTDSDEFKALIERGLLSSPSYRPDLAIKVRGSLLQKALMYSGSAVGGPFTQNDVQPGLRVPILQRELTVLDLVPTATTTSDTIEYVREDTWTNAAATVAEATAFDSTALGGTGVKPESAFAYSTQTSPVRTIAHWVPVTNQQLADAPQIRGIIDARLMLGLNLTLESEIISGAGTGSHLTGITNASNVNVQAIGTDNQMDAIFKGMNQVRITGLSNPTAIVLNPLDYQDIRLARENAATGTLGQYLMGPPSMPGPMTLWGRPIVESLGIGAGTGLTGDFAGACMLFDREQAVIRTGYINDQFIRNMTTLLAELRAAFVVWRGAAFSKITGI
jgi:HK97 family phage major capsid protein